MKSEPDAVPSDQYLMESEDEAFRLDIKTDPQAVRRQAEWCGVKTGMRILDAGCGSGKTTAVFHDLIQGRGEVTGVDYGKNRIEFARKNYRAGNSLNFYLRDIRNSLDDLGQFDLIFVRFVLEYYRIGALDIVKNLMKYVKPGGSLCLLDLDNNCLNYFDPPEKMAALFPRIMSFIDRKYNFDTFAGRKLYSYLYDCGFNNIEMGMEAHHLIYGEAKEGDLYNWMKKMEIGAIKTDNLFSDYEGGVKAFINDFEKFFRDTRRFLYTPLLMAKGSLT
jgi:SAM-dependent methyltransferase